MGKIRVEVCLISARGLRRTSCLCKLQWFAVGWIGSENKYCTQIDASGSSNPVWKTKFSTAVEESSGTGFQEQALNVEVYSREPVFLRESLLGSATIALKEFLDKYDVSKPVEEIGSFQLRKKNSNRPVGFIDVSIRVSEEKKEEPSSSHLGGNEIEGFNSTDFSGGINLLPRPRQLPPQPPPPPPPPPSNVGYTPSFFPMTNNFASSSYLNMPSSVAAPPQHRGGAGFGVGVGAGALAAGALIFGDDFMSGFDVSGATRDASATISTYPPFQ
ncbi:hypothetical protein ABFX02_06G055900 [Erythranthe guttata]